MPESNTARSQNLLRKQGFTVAVTEHWLSYPERINGHPTGKQLKVKRDLFGFADLVAVKAGWGTLYIQTTSTGNQSTRVLKIKDCAAAKEVLRAGNRIVVHGWKLSGSKGSRKLWTCTTTELYLENGFIESRLAEVKPEMQLDKLPF